jgi:citrate lyase subunit beta/citryl-CoA lyase
MEPALRSLLLVPGSEPSRLAEAPRHGADAIVADLGDGVAEADREVAPGIVHRALAAWDRTAGLAMVRVTAMAGHRLPDDLATVLHPRLDAVVLPRVERENDLRGADAALAGAERAAGLEPGRIRLLPTIESALGVARCEDIMLAAPPRTLTAVLGTADLAADLGLDPDLADEGDELLVARSRVVIACRAAGLAAPLDGPYGRLGDPDGLLRAARRSRRLGFQGRVVVHPEQVAVAQRGYGEPRAG